MGDDWKGKFDDVCKTVIYLPRTPHISTTVNNRKIVAMDSLVAPDHYAIPHAKYPDFAKQLYQIVRDFNDVMERCNVPYYHKSGTLLGAIRHGGLMQWDDDVDTVLFEDDLEKFIKLCIPTLACAGFSVSFRTNKFEGFKIKYTRSLDGKPLPFIDVFIVSSTTANPDLYGYSSGWPWWTVSKEQIFPLRKMRFGGTIIKAPKNSTQFLTTNYGPNWATHAVKYNHLFNMNSSELVELTGDDWLPAGPFGPLEDNYEKIAEIYRTIIDTSLEITESEAGGNKVFTVPSTEKYRTDLHSFLSQLSLSADAEENSYTQLIDLIYQGKRDERLCLCEFGNRDAEGLETRASLRTLKEHFQNAQIHGVYIDQSILFDESRIETYYDDLDKSIKATPDVPAAARVLQEWRKAVPNGAAHSVYVGKSVPADEDNIKSYYIDPYDIQELGNLRKSFKGINFDLIIDNGLQNFMNTTYFFDNYFPQLKEAGYYVVPNVPADQRNLLLNFVFHRKLNASLVELSSASSTNTLFIVQKNTPANLSAKILKAGHASIEDDNLDDCPIADVGSW